MAAHMIALARQEVQPEWRQVAGNGASTTTSSKPTETERGEPVEPKRVRYFYYTAGSGGVGTTILETSFLLAGTDVVVYVDGQEVSLPAVVGPWPGPARLLCGI